MNHEHIGLRMESVQVKMYDFLKEILLQDHVTRHPVCLGGHAPPEGQDEECEGHSGQMGSVMQSFEKDFRKLF